MSWLILIIAVHQLAVLEAQGNDIFLDTISSMFITRLLPVLSDRITIPVGKAVLLLF